MYSRINMGGPVILKRTFGPRLRSPGGQLVLRQLGVLGHLAASIYKLYMP